MSRALPILALLLLVWSSPALAAEYEYELNLGTIVTKDTPWGKQLTLLKKTIEDGSNGRIKVKLHFAGKMGDEVSMARQVKRGDLQALASSTAALATQVPEVGVFELCGLFKDLDEASKVIDAALTEPIAKILESNGFVLYVMGENGYRNFATKGKVIHSSADLKGLKMRSQEAFTHEEMYRALGGNPVLMPVSEVSSALTTGNIDGFDNTPLFAFAAQWYKGIDTWTVSDHIYQPAIIVYNKEWYDALPAELQAVVMEGRDTQLQLGRKLVRKMLPKLIENLEAAGVTVYHMTDAEKAAIAKECLPTHEAFVKKVGGQAQSLLDAAYAAKK